MLICMANYLTATTIDEYALRPVYSLLLACSLQARTSQQLYQSAQAPRQNECNKLVDRAEQDRCVQAAN